MGALAFDLEVVSISEPVPSVRRVRLSGPGLEAMDPKPGQDVMLAVTPTSRRRYSVRAYDAARPWVDLDFVLHGDGPAVTWASRATPGASIGVIGPLRKALVDEAAQWHLFAGDDTFVAATFFMVESLAADRRAVASARSTASRTSKRSRWSPPWTGPAGCTGGAGRRVVPPFSWPPSRS